MHIIRVHDSSNLEGFVLSAWPGSPTIQIKIKSRRRMEIGRAKRENNAFAVNLLPSRLCHTLMLCRRSKLTWRRLSACLAAYHVSAVWPNFFRSRITLANEKFSCILSLYVQCCGVGTYLLIWKCKPFL